MPKSLNFETPMPYKWKISHLTIHEGSQSNDSDARMLTTSVYAYKVYTRASEMSQQVRVLASKSDNLSSKPGIHMERTDSSDLHMCATAASPHKQTKYI